MKQIKRIGILTAGGDCPGLNAAIRGVGKAVLGRDIEAVGIRDGFLGLIENHTLPLDKQSLAGILTVGGTILGTSRVKPHRMEINGRDARHARRVSSRTARKTAWMRWSASAGTARRRTRSGSSRKGSRSLRCPKTIDNDVAMTDATFGFDTALGIATEAIDRLHSTAHSHHRIIVVEVMGHRAGWLTLSCGNRRRRRRHSDSGDSLQREADCQGDPAAQRAGHEFQHRRDRRGRTVARLCGPIPGGEGAQVQGKDPDCDRSGERASWPTWISNTRGTRCDWHSGWRN